MKELNIIESLDGRNADVFKVSMRRFHFSLRVSVAVAGKVIIMRGSFINTLKFLVVTLSLWPTGHKAPFYFFIYSIYSFF